MSTLLTKSILLSSVLMASAQLSTLPRRLRRGSAASIQSDVDSAAEEMFGRARDLEELSFSMSVSMSVDLKPAGADFLPLEFNEDEMMSSPTYEPSYFPTYVPTAAPIGSSPTAPPAPTTPPSYWPTYIPTADPVAKNPTKQPVPTNEPSYYPTYYPTQKPSGPTNEPVPTYEPSYYPTYYPTQDKSATTAPTYVFTTPEPTDVTARTPSDMQPLSSSEDVIICTKDRECPGELVCNCDFFCKFCFLTACGQCGPNPNA